MKCIACVGLLSVIARCKAENTCSSLDVCPGGAYQLCVTDGRCQILASDGSGFACASCSDCTGAYAQAQLQCRAHGGGGGGRGGGGSSHHMLVPIRYLGGGVRSC